MPGEYACHGIAGRAVGSRISGKGGDSDDQYDIGDGA